MKRLVPISLIACSAWRLHLPDAGLLRGNPVDRCVVDVKRDSAPVRVTESSRRACVSIARLLEPEAPDLTAEMLRTGHPGPFRLGPDDTVYCRFMPGARQGGSLKFYCLQTDSDNRFVDEAGRLVTEAVAFDDDGSLRDGAGRKIRDAKGGPVKGHELHVKFFQPPEPAPRYREMFTETIVGRFFWILGVPADRVYMPASVHCFGCAAKPDAQHSAAASDTAVAFPLASIKLAYAGRKIAVPRRDGFLGLGGQYDHGWSFRDVERFATRTEAELHALALNVVAYNNLHSIQNDLRCRAGRWDTDTGVCHEVVAYVSDIGGTLGGRAPVTPPGWDRPVMPRHPRGDFITFVHSSVFADPAACRLFHPIGDVKTVSEEARRLFAERVTGRIGRAELLVIMESARVHRMDSVANRYIIEEYGVNEDGRGSAPLHATAIQAAWADEFGRRLNEIVDGRCPGSG